MLGVRACGEAAVMIVPDGSAVSMCFCRKYEVHELNGPSCFLQFVNLLVTFRSGVLFAYPRTVLCICWNRNSRGVWFKKFSS